LVGF